MKTAWWKSALLYLSIVAVAAALGITFGNLHAARTARLQHEARQGDVRSFL